MKVGVLGGGQLGRMLALAGIPLGLEFVFIERYPAAPAHTVGKLLLGELDDPQLLKSLCEQVDVVTFESENISLATAQFVAQHAPLYPAVAALEVAQDRWHEKQFFNQCGIQTAAFLPIATTTDLAKAQAKLGFPFIVKTRREGYDGKGQFKVTNQAELDDLLQRELTDCIAEKIVNFEREISIIAVRSVSGEERFYDLCENHHQLGVLRKTFNKPVDPSFEQAKQYASLVLKKLNYVGVLVIEFFEKNGVLMANEMAPRVHNSGHWTIEGAVCSQFENHVRAICQLPLGDTRSLGLYCMTNIIGEMPNRAELLKKSGLHLHDYGKKPRPGRKLGHTNQMS